ncbi:protein kinase domain-containing protein [Trichonephila inaurata madagascariensis]|uniref:non-specific serine/threonine protein kinase n=1 Tax=Trichonephila inaurata madagascariensis TaxID=2747483 RepID=A0A8X7BUZ9_9ARAC|nr:protein kinase domain-containing protein [Trichonephila inaurata madagascariensis]
MSKQTLKPSELKAFLKFEGRSHYKLKHFIDIGNFTSAVILEDIFTKDEKVGKIVKAENEGEFFHWPKLRNENLIALLDIVPLDYQKAIFIFTFHEKNLRNIIKDTSFLQHPKCFYRKKSYSRDVLNGLEYLHESSLCLLNLSDQNISICSETDKAIISDFSCVRSAKFIAKSDYLKMSTIVAPPEFSRTVEDYAFECKPIDMWCCGIMLLQMFTMHVLPWCPLGMNLFEGLDMELLKQTNIGSQLQNNTATSLKGFLELFLQKDPQLRVSATAALISPFFQKSETRLDNEARVFWKACELSEMMPDDQLKRAGIYQARTKAALGDILFERKFQTISSKIILDKNKFLGIRLRKVRSNPELCVNKYSDEVEEEYDLHKGIKIHNHSNESLEKFSNASKTTHLKPFVDFYPRISYELPAIKLFCPANRTQEETIPEVELVKLKKKSWVKFDSPTDSFATQFQSSDQEKLKTICKDDKHSAETKCSEPQNLSFGLTCRCVSCNNAPDLEDSNQCIRNLPLGITYANSETDAPGTNQLNGTPFIDIQGGFLHNKWKIKRNNRSIYSSDQLNSPLSSYEKQIGNTTRTNFKESFCKSYNTKRNNPFIALLGNTSTEVTLPDSIQKPLGSSSDFSDQKQNRKQLILQRATGFRNRKSIESCSTRSLEQPAKNLCQICDDYATVISPTSIEERQRNQMENSPNEKQMKANAAKNKKRNNNSKVKEKLADNSSNFVAVIHETEDISMELPLCSEHLEDKLLDNESCKLINKQKHRWFRILCPGSRTESKHNV